jgi:ribosomal protein S18 acetylase RimI-like enzyme
MKILKLQQEEKESNEQRLWEITQACYTGVEVPERDLFHRCVRDGAVFIYQESPGGTFTTVGYALYTNECANSPLLRSIAVLREWRECGVGERLLRFSAEYFKQKDYKSLVLHCKVDNATAQRLYLKLGWRVTAVLRGYYKPEGDGLEMRKML